MKRLTVVLALSLLLAGCQQEPQTPTRPTPRPTVDFSGQALPEEVFRLKGTPLYSISEELAAQDDLGGAPFLLLASHDPSKALLVVVTDAAPAELKTRPSSVQEFSGKTESLPNAKMVDFVKSSFSLDLLTDDSGRAMVLKISSPPSPGNGGEAVPTPAATAQEKE